MNRTLELPEDVFENLVRAAEARGLAPAEWIAEKLPKPRVAVTREQAQGEKREFLRKYAVSTGQATGLDNEQIDADLAREYGDSHGPS